LTISLSRITVAVPNAVVVQKCTVIVGLAGPEGTRLLLGDYDLAGASQDFRNALVLIHHIVRADADAASLQSRQAKDDDARREDQQERRRPEAVWYPRRFYAFSRQEDAEGV
jgi:hypothetical protein